MENCLVTKLKGVVDNDNLVKLGELKVKVLSRKTVIIRWANFNANKHVVTTVSGNVNVTEESTHHDGYVIEAVGGDAVISATDRYNIATLSAESNGICYEIESKFLVDVGKLNGGISLLRCKVIGELRKPLVINGYLQDDDFTQASGVLNLSNASNVNDENCIDTINMSIIMPTDLKSTCNKFRFGAKAGDEFPITRFNTASNSINAAFNTGYSNVTGSIEDLNALPNITAFSMYSAVLNGDFERWVEKMTTAISTNKNVTVYGLYRTQVKIHNNPAPQANLYLGFSTNTVTIGYSSGASDVATYNKSTGTWTYA